LNYDYPWHLELNDHLGEAYIRAYLKQKGISSAQLVIKGPASIPRLVEKVKESNPDIVGITCYDTNYYFTKIIAEYIKKALPRVLIILGGPTATFSDILVMKDCMFVDVCVRGEGELITHRIIEALRENRSFAGIKGITWRPEGKITRNPPEELIESRRKMEALDIIPSPYLTGVLKENCGVVTARGCFYSCLFCNFSAISRWRVRFHSIERVLEEIKYLSGRYAHVNIWDDTFTLNPARAVNICKGIMRNKIRAGFWCQTRGDKVDRDMLLFFKKAGFKEVTFGLEHICPRILKIIKKASAGKTGGYLQERKYAESSIKNIRLAAGLGLNPSVNVILGLPGATYEDDRKMMVFLEKLGVGSYVHHILNLLPGTAVFEEREKYGLRVRKSLTQLPFNTVHSYPVGKISELAHSCRKRERDRVIFDIHRLFDGSIKGIKPGFPHIILSDNIAVNRGFAAWMLRIIDISPQLFFISGDFRIRRFRKILKKMLKYKLPVLHFVVIEKKGALLKEGKWKIWLVQNGMPRSLGYMRLFSMQGTGSSEERELFLKSDYDFSKIAAKPSRRRDFCGKYLKQIEITSKNRIRLFLTDRIVGKAGDSIKRLSRQAAAALKESP